MADSVWRLIREKVQYTAVLAQPQSDGTLLRAEATCGHVIELLLCIDARPLGIGPANPVGVKRAVAPVVAVLCLGLQWRGSGRVARAAASKDPGSEG